MHQQLTPASLHTAHLSTTRCQMLRGPHSGNCRESTSREHLTGTLGKISTSNFNMPHMTLRWVFALCRWNSPIALHTHTDTHEHTYTQAVFSPGGAAPDWQRASSVWHVSNLVAAGHAALLPRTPQPRVKGARDGGHVADVALETALGAGVAVGPEAQRRMEVLTAAIDGRCPGLQGCLLYYLSRSLHDVGSAPLRCLWAEAPKV